MALRQCAIYGKGGIGKAISAKLYTVVCDTSGRLSAIDPKPP